MSTDKFKATEILFARAEGRSHECVSQTFTGSTCWEDVENHIRSASRTAPEQGGYDKCDVTIKFEKDETGDEATYSLRYDMKHPNSGDFETLAKHVRSSWLFYAGRYTPPHLTPERHRQVLVNLKVDVVGYARLCDKYEVPGLS